METVYQNLHKEGIGVEIRHAAIITEEEEDRLWNLGILGDQSPRALVRSVFFLNGKNFCLRGGQEHRNLKLSQFVHEKDHWKYIETGSKNFRGGVADLRRENKVVRQYPTGKPLPFIPFGFVYGEITSRSKGEECILFVPIAKVYPREQALVFSFTAGQKYT